MARILSKNPSKNATYRPENTISDTCLTNGKRDYNGDHCDDQIKEQGHNVDYALNDRGEISCEIKSRSFHLLLQSVLSRSGLFRSVYHFSHAPYKGFVGFTSEGVMYFLKMRGKGAGFVRAG